MTATPFTRMAGWATLIDGSTITWTVADGRRGRRWREVLTVGPEVRHSLLLETGPDRRFSHLELARSDGLWTFHPEADRTLHGNHVDRSVAGISHVAGIPFEARTVLLVVGSPMSRGAIAWDLAQDVEVDSALERPGVTIHADGTIGTTPVRIVRTSPTRWAIGDETPFDLDGAGIPVFADGQTRPLEQHDPAGG